MLRAAIIDDNKEFIQLLQDLISSASLQIEIVATALNAKDGFAAVRKHKPDIVFLDVEMPGKSGIDLAKDFAQRDFEIVFTTSHDKYALNAIKVEAFDYLLKPVDSIELTKVIDKVLAKKRNKPVGINTGPQRLAVSSQDGIIFLDMNKIIRCEADNVYTLIFLDDKKKILSTKPISYYEEQLAPFGFVRVHKSHLVNVNQIKKYNRGETGYLLMNDESGVPVSKSGKEILHKAIRLE